METFVGGDNLVIMGESCEGGVVRLNEERPRVGFFEGLGGEVGLVWDGGLWGVRYWEERHRVVG